MGWREDRIAWYLEEIARMHQGIELMRADILTAGTEQSNAGSPDSTPPNSLSNTSGPPRHWRAPSAHWKVRRHNASRTARREPPRRSDQNQMPERRRTSASLFA
jgi:hypothetical protein